MSSRVLDYRADIDGLRAVAVLLVLLFHAGLGFPGGYIGVDVFFVISGFLITGLILGEQQRGTFTLRGFWGRRIRRIIPAATVVAAASLVAGLLLMLPTDLEELAQSVAAQQVMLSNVFFWRHTDYFDGPAEVKPLLHTWSLAVEEQFYLGFPFLLVLCRKFLKRHTALVLAALAVASLALGEWMVRRHPSAAFYLLPTRMWELLTGALLVFAPRPSGWRRSWREAGAWLGMAAILLAGMLFHAETPVPGAAALLPCLGTALVIFANSAELTSVGRFLAQRPVVFIGLVSYSLYLWHWPILANLRYWYGPDLAVRVSVSALLASLGLASLSWKAVEMPFRRGLQQARFRTLASGALCSAAVLMGVSGLIVRGEGLPERFPESVRRLAAPIEAPRRYGSTHEQVLADQLPQLGRARTADEPCDFLVWGDSHAMTLGDLLDVLAKEHGLCGVMAARPNTAPVLGVWRPARNDGAAAWNEAVLEYIREHRVANVILISRWEENVELRPNGRGDALITDDPSTAVSAETAREALARGLDRTVAALEAAGARVWIVKQVPLQPDAPQRAVVRAALFGGGLPVGVSLEEHQQRQKSANAIIEAVSRGGRGVNVLDPAAHCFDPSGRSRVASDEGVFYRDEDHLSPLGAECLLRPMFDPVFDAWRQSRSLEAQSTALQFREMP